jgi:hypothetical protein
MCILFCKIEIKGVSGEKKKFISIRLSVVSVGGGDNTNFEFSTNKVTADDRNQIPSHHDDYRLTLISLQMELSSSVARSFADRTTRRSSSDSESDDPSKNLEKKIGKYMLGYDEKSLVCQIKCMFSKNM